MIYSKEHIDALKEVIKRYESITDIDILRIHSKHKATYHPYTWEKMPYLIRKELVFEDGECLLCKSLNKNTIIDKECMKCILFVDEHPCVKSSTYLLMGEHCLSIIHLVKLINARIKYLKRILSEKTGVEL
ncbi:MAG TPA: hypothetical protein VI815_02370 [Candidatus Nanoarchaeia archaeon]|nr:hypothetical protein [Candidatus Nanoarchaeia archaeon]